ncbi:4Fe-4S dicluster domain-containing protein [Chloroflexota bacterium]
MDNKLPILILEPALEQKREAAASRLFPEKLKGEAIPPALDLSEVKQHLKTIRQQARDNIAALVSEFQTNLEKIYPGVRVTAASDSAAAVQYITGIADDIRVISTNNSGAVTQELRPGLAAGGFTVTNSYLHEFEVAEKKILDYWDLPRLLDREIGGTFEVAEQVNGLAEGTAQQYLALLGANSVSAADGTILFLEHFKNIHTDLQNAQKVVIVVGLDKIVASRADASFQARCMGTFGLENILLGVGPRADEMPSIEEMSLPPAVGGRELHVIILDNGRGQLPSSRFEDLFLCIGCRACNNHCPIRHSFSNTDYIWTPKNYLTQFLRGRSNSIDISLHCEACRLECPVDIDLPHLMWRAKEEYLKSHGISLSHRILGSPELLAKIASPLAPLANFMMRIGLVRIIMEFITGIDRKTKLPTFHTRTFRKWYGKNG